MSFENKKCIVTGGANGIGRYIAEEFIKAGALVYIIDADEKSGKLLEKKYDGKYFFFCGDLSEKKVLDAFAGEVLKRFGSIDCLVNNAALSRKGLLSDCSYEDFNYVMHVGVSAPYYLSLLFKNHLNGGAAIVNISSTRAFMSQADTESYSAAKGGIYALTHALSISLAGRVRVNSISPGWIETDVYGKMLPDYSEADKKQHPAGRVGVPADIADLVLYLCSEKAGFITGQDISVDGGMSKNMIYSGEGGWSFDPSPASEVVSEADRG